MSTPSEATEAIFFSVTLFWELQCWNEFISYANLNICMQLKINVVNFNDCFK